MLKINKFLLILGIGLFLAWPIIGLRAQSSGSDAIAVRIIPNPNHYSITRWYESRGFQGAPQLLKVDGYEAIRDGRTVYVNAANVNLANNKIYTNIYLISYNQNPGVGTGDILGQIIARWKFNDNLVPELASCSISNTACLSQTDCGSNQRCSTTTNSCELEVPKNCLVDTDCPANFFCDSLKAKISRDVIRISRLEDLKQALARYYQINNHYPALGAGTYLAGQSLSVWPSWNQTFLTEIAASPALTDPINRLGICTGSGFDPATCWNAETKQFSNLSGNQILLPAASRGFHYSSNELGSHYSLCGTIETSYDTNYRFEPGLEANSICAAASSGLAINTAPVISDKFLMGIVGDEFVGYIKAYDPEGNPLVWTLDTGGTNWSGSGWSAAPKLEVSSDPGQARISAQRSGNPGSYNIKITVADSRGGSLTTTTPIIINAAGVNISADDAEYTLDPTKPFNYSFTFSGRQLTSPSSAYTVTKISGAGSGPLSFLDKSFSASDGIYQVKYSGLIPTSTKFTQDTSFKYRINISPSFTKTFNIKIKSPAPSLNINCLNSLRTGVSDRCLLGPLTYNNQKITYTVNPSLAGNSLIYNNELIIDKIGVANTYNYIFKATNEYGASSTQPFALKVNSFCGDGKRQTPNTEGRGGFYNDGYEDCDINSGVTNIVGNSSPNNQYACRTINNQTPNPILTGGYCVYKPPFKTGSDDVGGYCGDGYCQVKVNGQLMENNINCPKDCSAAVCVPSCGNKVCGSNGCGGSCGPDCSSGFCNNNGQCQLAKLSGRTFLYQDSELDNLNQPQAPVGEVKISIRDQSLAIIASTSSSRQGGPNLGTYELNIPGSLAGNYEITASREGYDSITSYFTKDELINIYLNSTTSLDFILTRTRRPVSYQANLKIMLVWGNPEQYHDSVLAAGSAPNPIFINAANITPTTLPYQIYKINGNQVAALDRNNIGEILEPENVMIYQYPTSGTTFQYYVNTAMVNGNCSFENAKVYVFDENNKIIRTFDGCRFEPANPSIPICPAWRLFKIDEDGAIIANDNCENVAPPDNPIGEDPKIKDKTKKEKKNNE